MSKILIEVDGDDENDARVTSQVELVSNVMTET